MTIDGQRWRRTPGGRGRARGARSASAATTDVPRPRRRGRAWLVAPLLALAVACSPARLLTRYFLSACPADGPEPERELVLHLEPVPQEAYGATCLASAPPGTPHRIVARVGALSIHHFGPMGTRGGPRLLVVAGVHGNEIAGTLAAPLILADLRDGRDEYAGVEVHVVTPANPEGLRHLSRYNGAGCDVNRDFERFATVEARAVRDVFTAVEPALVLALHEGPQDGFYVVATRSVPAGLAATIAAAVADAGLPLATRSFVRLPLGVAGADDEGWAMTWLKRVLRLGSLGTYGERRSVGTLTTESPWASTDLDGRVRAHVLASRVAARRLGAEGARAGFPGAAPPPDGRPSSRLPSGAPDPGALDVSGAVGQASRVELCTPLDDRRAAGAAEEAS